MADGKHTPGPWARDGLIVGTANGATVCWMGEPAQYPGDISKQCENYTANALLIVATPELLEALRPLAALTVPDKPEGNAGFYSIRHEDINAARAAIAKATGEAG